MSADPAKSAAAVVAPTGRRRLALVTGMSGAGRSTALHALEDGGYEAVDNLPLSLLGALLRSEETSSALAIGVDTRTRGFAAPALLDELDRARGETAWDARLLFIDCDDEVLRRRFTETRRRHPLAADRPVTDGIRAERIMLRELRERADIVIDTSALTAADLRRRTQESLAAERAGELAIQIVSFAYRNGLPRDADLVFDVRFLSNPHYVPELQALTGCDAAVAAYIERDPAAAAFIGDLTAMLEFLLPRFQHEGKSYLTVAVGCTGGRHRSVYTAERLAAWLRARGRRVDTLHRDMPADRRLEDRGLSAAAPEKGAVTSVT